MDVSLLEEQYDHIKQKQKLQSYIIVFKTGMLILLGKNANVDVNTIALNLVLALFFLSSGSREV